MAENTEKKKSTLSELMTNSGNGFVHDGMLGTVVQYINQELGKMSQSRAGYYSALGKSRDNYLVNGIYDILANDVFISSGQNTYLTVELTDDESAQRELELLFENLNIPELVMSIFNDLMHYGTYSIGVDVDPSKGVMSLDDMYDPSQVIAVTDGLRYPLFYYVSKKQSSTLGDHFSGRTNFEYKSVGEILHFSIGLQSAKLNIPDRLHKNLEAKTPRNRKKDIPSSVKVKESQSFIWPIIDKIQDILLQDKVTTYKNIAEYLSPNIVGIPMPELSDVGELVDVVKKYEELLNGNLARLDSIEDFKLTLKDIARVKPIPIAGDKGAPSVIDTSTGKTGDNNENLQNSVRLALNSLGVPPELFFGETDSKTNIKTNVRYAKKVKRIQKAIVSTLTELCLLHLSKVKKGKKYRASDINISMKNNVNIDELENLESVDMLVSSIGSMKALLEDVAVIAEGSDFEIDKNAIMSGIKKSLESIGSHYASAIKSTKEDGEDPDSSVPLTPKPNEE